MAAGFQRIYCPRCGKTWLFSSRGNWGNLEIEIPCGRCHEAVIVNPQPGAKEPASVAG